jgi:hypothetical protein
VVLTSPDGARAADAAAAVRASCAGACVTPLVLDQRTAAGVAAFVAAYDAAAAAAAAAHAPWRLRALVCNAATFSVDDGGSCDGDDDGGSEGTTAECVDGASAGASLPRRGRRRLHVTLAVNALGAWRVCAALAPRLAPHSGRVVTVASFTHRSVSRAALLAWLHGDANARPDPATAYAMSKAALAAAAVAAAGDAGAPRSILVDPGLIDTSLVRAWPRPMRRFLSAAGAATGLLRPPAEGARAVLAALAAPDAELDAASAAAGANAPPLLYLFGAAGVPLRPAPAGGGHAPHAAAVLAALRALDNTCE